MIDNFRLSPEGLTYKEEQTLEKIAQIKIMLDDPFIRENLGYLDKSKMSDALEVLRKVEDNIVSKGRKRNRHS